MQQAVPMYKTRGGGYIGEKSRENPLIVWEHEWGNISGASDAISG